MEDEKPEYLSTEYKNSFLCQLNVHNKRNKKENVDKG